MNCNSTSNDITNTKPTENHQQQQQHRNTSLVSNDDLNNADLDSDILDQVIKSGGDDQFNMLHDLDGSDLVLDNDGDGGSIDILLDEVLDGGGEGLIDLEGHDEHDEQLDTKSDTNNSQDLLEDIGSISTVGDENDNNDIQPINSVNNKKDDWEYINKLIAQQSALKQQEDTAVQLSKEQQQHTIEQTLRGWIDNTKSNYTTGYLPNEQLDDGYIKSALPVAIKLSDFFIQLQEMNITHLTSINAENVLIYLKRTKEGETIDSVLINSGDNCISFAADGGSTQSRLFAVGLILYELFSTEEPLVEDIPPFTSASVRGINLNDMPRVIHRPPITTSENDQRPLKRSHHRAQTGDKVSTCIAKLEDKGLPRSICTLVKNLLDCSKGDYCGDEAYSSFVDLRQDLLLMMNNPTCFLDNLQISGSIPTLEICNNKLYGRQDEEEKLNKMYQQYLNEKTFKGVIISGGAGAGKSMLALHTKRLTNKSNGHFCSAKFEQNEMYSKPLATIGDMFNTLCDAFAEEASPNELELVEKELENRLGNQASLLAGVVPSLIKLMPSSKHQLETSTTCIDAAVSMRYLFGELLRVISSHSKRPISLFIDDLQFADHSSLQLIEYLLYSAKGGSSVFFIFCHRDDEDSLSGPFSFWLSSIMISMESIELGNMSVESVNTLVSEILHLSPRITHPLSDVLQHKTRGNPLFLRQLLGSLYRQGNIYVDLSLSRWSWDMDKIEQEPISSSVVALLTKEMKGLSASLQLGLGVASCLGSSIQKEVLDVLSKDLNIDLVDILKEVSHKGFMDNTNDGTTFCFTHDKIQEAGMYHYHMFCLGVVFYVYNFSPHSHYLLYHSSLVHITAYELESKEKRRANHLRYGLVLCTHTLDKSGVESNELFFTSITQINHGGPNVVHDPSQKSIISGLNLKAGRLSIALSDYAAAFALFEHGISYLGSDKWVSNYDLSIELYDAAAEAACVLNKRDRVGFHVGELVAHAKTFDDSVHCK